MLPHETTLANGRPGGFALSIGGAVGPSTRAGDRVAKPEGMPDRDEWDYTVTTYEELRDACRDENAIIGYGDHIDHTQRETITVADNVTLVGGYCDPDVQGVGYWSKHDNRLPYTDKLFEHAYGEPVKLYGVYFLGPRLHYFDPDHTSDSFDDLWCSGLHEYADRDDGKFRAIGCRFTGFTVAGLQLGAKDYETDAIIRRCTGTRNNMEHFGYAISQLNGEAWIDRCFFNRCRHAIAGFGYPTEYLDLTESVFGPDGWSGHLIDRHGIDAMHPVYDAHIAGGYIRIRNCTIMGTRDIGGYPQEGEAIRGVSIDQSKTFDTHFFHDNPPFDTPPNTQGEAIRQEVNAPEFKNLKIYGNIYDPNRFVEGIGAPPAARDVETDEEISHDPPTETPEPEHSVEDPDTLSFHGTGSLGGYWLFIEGNARPADRTERSEAIEYDGKHTLITGRIRGGVDEFEIDGDATLVGAWFTTGCTLERDGEPVEELPSLIAAHASGKFRKGKEDGPITL